MLILGRKGRRWEYWACDKRFKGKERGSRWERLLFVIVRKEKVYRC